MTSSHQASSSSTPNFQPIFERALKDYKKKTGTDLTTHPLAAEINDCDTPESILAVLQGRANELNQSRSSDDRLTKWLKPTVNILDGLSTTLGEGAGSVFPPTKIIFSGIGILLIAAKSTMASRDVLVELFSRIESFFRHLETYTEAPPTQVVTDVLVKVMAEVLSVLAIATKGVKERRTKTILKKLAGMSDIEDALQRFRKLEQAELLTVIAQVLRETKGDAKQTDGISKEIVNARDSSSSLDERALSPEEPPAPAPEISHSGSWRSVHQSDGFRSIGKKSEAHSPGPVIEMPMRPPPGPPPNRLLPTGSWETWLEQHGVEYSPPPSESEFHLTPEFPSQPRGLFGPRSPRSSNEALSLEEPSGPPRPGAWRSVHKRGGFRRTGKKPEARPAWEAWKVQAGLQVEYTSPEGPPQPFIPCLPRSSIEEFPTLFRPSAGWPVQQRGVFKRTRKKSEAHPPMWSPLAPGPPPDRAQGAGSWATWQVQPGLEYTPPPSEPEFHLAPEFPSQPRGLFGPRSPRSSIEGLPAPVHQRRVFRRTHKNAESHPPGGVMEAPMHTPPAHPPGRVRRRAVRSGQKT